MSQTRLVKPLTACVPFAFVFYFIYHIVVVNVLFDGRDKPIRVFFFIIIITLPFLCECSIFFHVEIHLTIPHSILRQEHNGSLFYLSYTMF